MKKAAARPKTVLETILDWSQDRPAWQRDALRRIVSKGRLDIGDLTELTELCKAGRGGTGNGLQAEPLAKAHLPANPGQGAAVSLISIAEVNGVNNLAPGQTLTFEQNGITIVYGDNGAGKSGYARVLKRACRARHAGKIEPNIYALQPPPARATATIAYSAGGKKQSPEKWKDAEHPHPILSAVSVFDSDCAAVHIKDKNEVAFRPFGLDVPDELANACQAVKEGLTNELKQLEKARNPLFLKPSWKETTNVGKALAVLKHDTDLKKIEDLGILTEEENARLTRLKEDLSKNPGRAAAEQSLKADNIKRLLDGVNLIEQKTTDKALAGVASAMADAGAKREAARLAANKAFSGEPLKGVGGEVWRVLWDAARRYSTEIVYPGQPFPSSQADARCVLCQQTLGAEARDRMSRFEEFIQKDTERQAQEAEKTSKSARHELAAVVIATRFLKSNLQEVALQNLDLARRARRFIATCRLRRYALFNGVGKTVALPVVAVSPAADLAQLEKVIRDYAAELKNSAAADERKKLELELAELSDRAMLGGITKVVRDEVERLRTIQFLTECLGDTTTNAITKVGNDIADTVITPKLRDRFQEEIVKLAADKVRVEIVRSGGKYGSPQYQVRLFAKPDAKVQDILSEGEKTCVALAAFLTELATAAHKSTLVFDDPVSSLDHRWRKQVATRLVEEAGERQIIVFTHDLVFVNDLYDLGLGKKRPMRLFTVSRGQSGTGVVTDGMPWKAQRVEERIDNLEKDARAAKTLYDNNQQDDYNREAASLYNGLRASWERALEDVAFFRVVQRHRDYIDTKHLKKASVLTEADCDAFHAGFKKCSDVVDAHDPSSGRNADAPPPNELMQDIQALKDWVASLRDRQKKIA
ncbi:MAG: AAA family ATPase [Bryobacteraceae bacterium]|jgi:energy-coupling factor transporter ATP-binding protein EcfA2